MIAAFLIACLTTTLAPVQAAETASTQGQRAPERTPDSGDKTEPNAKDEGQRDLAATQEGDRLQMYGFLRLDAIIDSARPNAIETPLFVLPKSSTNGENGTTFVLHPRLARFGLNATSRRLEAFGQPVVNGKLEIDFQNGGSESRAVPRFRHAYLNVAWKHVSLLAGQTWDLISPLFPAVNADTMMWNAGNLGDRRPQVRLTYEPGTKKIGLSLAGAIGLTGAVDGQDLDGNGVLDGAQSGLPNFQARVAASFAVDRSDRRAAIGVSGHLARERVALPIKGQSEFSSNSISVDYIVPLKFALTILGEAWRGVNLSDFRGGIGQGINMDTARGIRSHGGWLEIGKAVGKYYAINGGYTLDNPEDDVARIRNRTWYLVNRVKFGAPFTIGVDYLNWQTTFRTGGSVLDHRINAYLIFSF